MSLTVVVLSAFVIACLLVLFLVVRHRAVFKIFLRSSAGNRRRFALIVVGLMVGTSMITGALVMRSTMLTLSDNVVLLSYGHIDETVTAGSSLSGPFFNQSAAGVIENSSPPAEVSGIIPMIYETVSAFDATSRVPYIDMGLVAEGGNASALLGPFISVTGKKIWSVPEGNVLLDQYAARVLDASPGDRITLFEGNRSINATVFAIVRDNYRGYLDYGFNAFLPLTTAQQLFNAPNEINMIAVANTGTVLGAAELGSRVMSWLNSTLPSASTAAGTRLSAYSVVEGALKSVNGEIRSISDLYLALSVFAMASGLILVVVIFYTLAEERSKELGLLRVLGARKSDILGGFTGEGFVYTLLSCFAGSIAGIGIGFIMVIGFIAIFGSTFSLPLRDTGALLSSFTVTPSDIIYGFSAGGLATLLVIAVTSYSISSMSSTAAMRGMVERTRPVKLYITASLLLAVVPPLLYSAFVINSLMLAMLSLSLLPFSMALIASARGFITPGLLIAGVWLLLFWGLPQSWQLFSALHSSYYVYVESGVFLVTGGLMIFMGVRPFLLSLLSPRGRQRGVILPATRQAFSYLFHKKLRTALSLSLFAFVVFGIISVSVLGNMIDGAAISTVQQQGGGYSFVLYSAGGTNLTSTVSENASLSQLINYESLIYDTSAAAEYNGSVFVYPLVGVPSQGETPFYLYNTYPIALQNKNFASPRALWQAVAGGDYAIIDMSLGGIKQGDYSTTSTNAPVVPLGGKIELFSGNRSLNVTVIAVLREFGLQGIFVSTSVLSHLGLLHSAYPVLFVRLKSGVSAAAASVTFRRTLYKYNPVLVDLSQIASQLTGAITGIVEMTEIFIGMGLVAGTAGLGIIGMRSVIERRQQIGLMRAIGFTRRLVSASFLMEFMFLAIIGSAIGVAMSLLNSYIISVQLGQLLPFSFNASTIILLVILSASFTALAVMGSARRVSRIEPSVALRYME
ncbi:MAG: FtsX-like permease family protein [Methanomassiliicoccales archaeon]